MFNSMESNKKKFPTCTLKPENMLTQFKEDINNWKGIAIVCMC
jgi:hypothetical protein